MKVVLGCEESGVGRRAFRDRGHDAISCDLLLSRDNSPHHVQGDIIETLNNSASFDLGIFHPDCTTVCVAGNRHYAGTQQRQNQIQWIVQLAKLARVRCVRVAIENPASVIFPVLRRHGFTVQYIQPYEHGHPEQKKTGLALWNLPPLVPSSNVWDQMQALPKSRRERIFYMSPGENRKRDRSESYPGILAAMAEQWGVL